MSLFEVGPDSLIPFRQLAAGGGEYDAALEEVLWRNLDSLAAEPLFRIRRQAPLAGGGHPAIIALDRKGGVVVAHVRAQVDRSGLAECLEYAGWARTTSLPEIASLYWRGEYEFWTDWQEFTGSAGPQQLARHPRLLVVTADLAGRAGPALEFLVEHGLPVTVIKAALYSDDQGRRILDVQGPDELETGVVPSEAAAATYDRLNRAGRRSTERATAPSDRARQSGRTNPDLSTVDPDLLGQPVSTPTGLTAEQLGGDPLGVDRIVAVQLAADAGGHSDGAHVSGQVRDSEHRVDPADTQARYGQRPEASVREPDAATTSDMPRITGKPYPRGTDRPAPRPPTLGPPTLGPSAGIVPPPPPNYVLSSESGDTSDNAMPPVEEQANFGEPFDPRMLRVPESFQWDPQRTNGSRDNGR